MIKITGFQWDKGNIDKNLEKHGVSNQEIEEMFFDVHKREFSDTVHSGKEIRYRILGKTKKERLLFVVYTIRGDLIRVISARDITKKEANLYEKSS